MTTLSSRCVIVAAAVLISATGAAAQSSRAALAGSRAVLAGGLSFANFDAGTDFLPRQRGIGWTGDLGITLTDRISVVADFGSHYGNAKGLSNLFGLPVGEPGFSAFHLLLGPRVALQQGRTQVFAHSLAGFSRGRLDAYDLFGTTIPPETSTDLAFALGAGVDVAVMDRLAIRVAQIDYLPVHGGGDDERPWTHSVRVMSGVVWRFPR